MDTFDPRPWEAIEVLHGTALPARLDWWTARKRYAAADMVVEYERGQLDASVEFLEALQ